MKPLEKGDLVALLAPASAVKGEYCDGAEAWLKAHGFRVCRYPSAGGFSGSYSAPEAQRIAELHDALSDPEVKAVLCARGGYGCVHLLEHLSDLAATNPKWIIGFSDVSALHAMMQTHGHCSIHASMAKHLTLHPDDETSCALLATLTTGKQQPIFFPTLPCSHQGKGSGMLIGGNLAVINSLASTPWDTSRNVLERDCILVVEDISEAIYAVERMMFRLHLAGTLARLKGLIVGQFTEYRADRNHHTMEEMLAARLRAWMRDGVPVAFGAPIGHVERNLPLLLGSRVTLTVGPHQTVIK